MRKLRIPRFQTEAEEAKWWNDRMDVDQARLVQGIKTGNVHRGGPKRVIQERQESKNITIRVGLADIERARTLAAEKGVSYQFGFAVIRNPVKVLDGCFGFDTHK